MKKRNTIWVGIAILTLCACLVACGKSEDTVKPNETQETEVNQNTKDASTKEGSDSINDQESGQMTEEDQDLIQTEVEGAQQTSVNDKANGIEDMLTDYYDDYKSSGGMIAYVTGVSQMEDGSFNQMIYDGIRLYANSAGVSYSYYMAYEDTDEEYTRAVDDAISSGSSLIVCGGVHFEKVIGRYQSKYPEIAFLMIDGTPKDENGEELQLEPNVYCAAFREEESSYLAGYCAVLDGYRKFGFIGGEKVPPVERFGYGYLLGIEEAAKTVGCVDQIEVDYWYSDSFLPQDETEKMADEWYKKGCEVIFACGGSLYESVLEAAEEYDKQIIGVDVDQSAISKRVLTSAMKGVDRAVVSALDDYFAYGKWSEEMSGQIINYGIAEWCGGLPTNAWRFEKVSLEEYGALYMGIRDGSIVIPHETDSFPNTTVKVNNYDEE